MQVLHESPTEIKRSILCQIYKQEENKGEKGGGVERKGKTRDGGRQEGGRRERKLAALPSMPAVCEKAAVAY